MGHPAVYNAGELLFLLVACHGECEQNDTRVIWGTEVCWEKGVIVCVFEEGTRNGPYGHCLVAGLAKYPKKVIRKESAKKSRVKVFLKLVNFTHLMPTCYTLGVDLKEVVSGSPDSLTTKDKKLPAAKSAKAKLEERLKTGKNRWFFTKLRMIRHDST
ncbi:60S ribosomal protein L27-3 [Hordeum vulgare]|nr:60S ribosomal protein L27-3 [Hordeum vulgare]